MIERVVRVAATWLVLGLVAAAFYGCGSTSPETRAQAINLRPGDVPGASAGIVIRRPITYGPLTKPTESCDGGLPGPRGAFGYSSRRLYVPPSYAPPPGVSVPLGPLRLRPLVTARSVVYMFGSEAAALRELEVVSSARARDCLRHEAQQKQVIGESSGRAGSTEHESLNGPLYTHVQVRVLPTSLPHSYRLRLTGDDTFFPGPARPVYNDSFGFVAGSAFVVLYTSSEPHPFPALLELRLRALLYSRATGKTRKTVLIIKRESDQPAAPSRRLPSRGAPPARPPPALPRHSR